MLDAEDTGPSAVLSKRVGPKEDRYAMLMLEGGDST